MFQHWCGITWKDSMYNANIVCKKKSSRDVGGGEHRSGSGGLNPAYGASPIIRLTLSYIKMPLTLPRVQ